MDAWDHPLEWTGMHQPGIASISGKKIILARTTLERVAQFHKPVLESAVERANQHAVRVSEEKASHDEQKQRSEEEHRRNVAAGIAKITF